MQGGHYAKLIMEVAECVRSVVDKESKFPMSVQKTLKQMNDLVEELFEELRTVNYEEPEAVMVELLQVHSYLDLAKRYHRFAKDFGDGPSCEAYSCAQLALNKATNAYEQYFLEEE